MACTLREQINKRSGFASPHEEAMLNVQRTASHLGGVERAFFRPYGLSPPAYNLLRILRGHLRRAQEERGGHGDGHAHGGVRASRIGCEMVVRMPDVTRLVDRLERSGLVSRASCAGDKRVKFVRITPRGLDLLARIDPEVVKMGRAQLGHMSEAQLTQLSRLLELARNEGAGDRGGAS